ncbi:MAG: hypothetical protein QN187_13505 [Armatimonadota bacterium]|nr:hypothetical protein [Armatimonadota bacterium]MDR7532310.1 hypothetical protein [Armatimonadota bacterium]
MASSKEGAGMDDQHPTTPAGGPVRHAGVLGALIALWAAAAFAVAAHSADAVARWGGAVWVFILTWIILMPVLTPWLRARSRA